MKTNVFLAPILVVSVAMPVMAQIPVTDVAMNVRTAIGYVETMAKWKTQYQQMMDQINTSQRQYQALSGARQLGLICNNPALRDYLPQDWKLIFDKVRDGGYAGLSGKAKAIYDANKVFDISKTYTDPAARKVAEARSVKPSQDKAVAMDGYDAAKSRINQIDQLMQRINQTNDPKAIAELQARIATEQANIQNEQTKLQLYAMVSDAEAKIQADRQRQLNAQLWSSRKGIQAKPLTFD
jgi:type IV secretion system protein VirB5